MKHVIRILLGLNLIGLIIAVGLFYHFGLWIYLIVALIALVYPAGWLLGKVIFPPVLQ